jgi:hypothetical protein
MMIDNKLFSLQGCRFIHPKMCVSLFLLSSVVLFTSFTPVHHSASSPLSVTPGAYAIDDALIQARELRRLQGATDVDIHLAAGTYRLYQSVRVRPEDNHTHFIADGDVTISGGVKIEGWRREGKCYVADVPDFTGCPLDFRQMWVNGKKAIRARDVEDFEKMNRIRSVDKKNEIIWVPAAAVDKIRGEHHAEMALHEMWCLSRLRISSISVSGDSAAVRFCQPESRIHFMRPWPSPVVDGKHNSPFFLTNARQLMDSPGEWYLDSRESKVYYIPRDGENMQTADVEVPAVETLIQVEGTPDQSVHDVTFSGITFSYSTWMRPSHEGHVPLQAGMFMTEAYKLRPSIDRADDHKLDNQGWVGRPASAVSISCADSVDFSRCTFEHLASTAVDYFEYVHGGAIDHCTFRDVGGSAILAGSFSPESMEAHLPYRPSDDRIVCRGLRISDNIITDAANEDWGCLGIGAGYVSDIDICHNEISDVSYTGISLGWGWNRQPCAMSGNHVWRNLIYHYARHLYDVAGIYTLGSQPGTVIEENTVRDIYHPSYVHDTEHWFYLYTDEGSSHITLRNNWTPTEKYLKNANGPGNVWENNGMISPQPQNH